MPYTKPAQAQYVNLLPGEFVVKIDTTPQAPVAVSLHGHVDANTGNFAVDSYARVVTPDGSDYLDANGSPLKTTFHTSMDKAGLAQLGGPAAFKKLMYLTVLGEDVTNGALKWVNALPVDVLEHASIRTNIAAAQAAVATDPSTLL